MSIAVAENRLGIPPPKDLPGANSKLPCVIVGNEAFPLKTYLVKPYVKNNLTDAKRICNYRISRARRVIGNCSDIATSRFIIFQQPIFRKVDTVILITKAVVALHNYLMCHESILPP